MNKAKLRELFANVKGDVDDYYDAQRDLVEAQRRLLNRVFDIVESLAPEDDGVIAQGDGVTVMRPPEGVTMPCCRMGCEKPTTGPGDLFCAEHGGENKPIP